VLVVLDVRNDPLGGQKLIAADDRNGVDRAAHERQVTQLNERLRGRSEGEHARFRVHQFARRLQRIAAFNDQRNIVIASMAADR
jgi:hypothetical protein